MPKREKLRRHPRKAPVYNYKIPARRGFVPSEVRYRHWHESYALLWPLDWEPEDADKIPTPIMIGQRVNDLLAPYIQHLHAKTKPQKLDMGKDEILELLGNGWEYISTDTKKGRQWIATHSDFVASNPRVKWDGANRLYVNTSTDELLTRRTALNIIGGKKYEKTYAQISPTKRGSRLNLHKDDEWTLAFHGTQVVDSPKLLELMDQYPGEFESEIGKYVVKKFQVAISIMDIPDHTIEWCSELMTEAYHYLDVDAIDLVIREFRP